MLALIAAHVLMMSGSCQERCASDTSRCYSGCGNSKSCSHHCDDKAVDCNAGCAKEQAKAEEGSKGNKQLPCGMQQNKKSGREEMRPCSESEAKVFNEALDSPEAKKLLKCKNSKGVAMPCKDDMEKEKAIVDAAGGKEGLCADKNGNPRVCDEAAKRVENAARKK